MKYRERKRANSGGEGTTIRKGPGWKFKRGAKFSSKEGERNLSHGLSIEI